MNKGLAHSSSGAKSFRLVSSRRFSEIDVERAAAAMFAMSGAHVGDKRGKFGLGKPARRQRFKDAAGALNERQVEWCIGRRRAHTFARDHKYKPRASFVRRLEKAQERAVRHSFGHAVKIKSLIGFDLTSAEAFRSPAVQTTSSVRFS